MNDVINLEFSSKLALFILVGFCTHAQVVLAATHMEPLTFYVSTTVNDRADGHSPSPTNDSKHGPFATQERARNELRVRRTPGQSKPRSSTDRMKERR